MVNKLNHSHYYYMGFYSSRLETKVDNHSLFDCSKMGTMNCCWLQFSKDRMELCPSYIKQETGLHSDWAQHDRTR